ncbi:MAG TPA: hypothetical protein VGE07_21020 [Herpetosiphonaceae bacterium]
MSRRSLLIAMIVGVLFSLSRVPAAKAVAYGANWQTSFTIQNIGASSANFTIRLYSKDNASLIYTYNSPAALAPGASTSVTARSIIGGSADFNGSATVSSPTTQLAVAMVQFAPGISHRPLSTAVQSSNATNTYLLPLVMDLLPNNVHEGHEVQAVPGSVPAGEDFAPAAGAAPPQIANGVNATGSTVIIPTALKTVFNTNSIIAIQSAAPSGDINITFRFYAVGATSPTWTASILNQPPYRTTFLDLAGNPNVQLPSGFTGSMVATATYVSGGAAAPLAAMANEFAVNSNNSAAFEGTSAGAVTVYMPSAQCTYAAQSSSTAYAVQNVNLSASLTFALQYDTNVELNVMDGPYTVSAGGKKSVGGCDVMANNRTGSAIISRTAGTGTMVVVGKVSGGGLSTAFLGFTGGTARVALPYVRWSPNSTFNTGTRQRTNIAIQNVGQETVVGAVVQYIDRNGTVIKTDTLGNISPGGKVNSDPASALALDSCGRFGEYGGGADCLGTSFGGGAVVVAPAGSTLAVLARVYGLGSGEDYSGVNDQ